MKPISETVKGLSRPRWLRDFGLRVRTRGPDALARAGRMTAATVVAYLVAEVAGLHEPPPLIAALTALLVVQATLVDTLASGVQRVLSVVAGVGLATFFVSVVGLTWWSLGTLVAASLVVGQLLRLGPNLVEVPISAMLVLGVGAAGAGTVGTGRVVETFLGAVVGVAINLLFPPAVQTRHAGQSLERFAVDIAGLLEQAAAVMAARGVTVEETGRWLDDARRLNRHAPRVDRALAHAEESRRLNLRALRLPASGLGLREGLDALEHASVSLRTLFRAIADATRGRIGVDEDPGYAADVRMTAAELMARMSGVIRCFGDLLHAEGDSPALPERERLTAALADLRNTRRAVHDLLLDDPRSRDGLWELNSVLLTTADRMSSELDVATHASRDVHRVQAATALRLARQAAEGIRQRNRPPASRRGEDGPSPTDGPTTSSR